jgi:hypothetical protein
MVAIVFAPNLTEKERARLVAETVSQFSIALTAGNWDLVTAIAVQTWMNDPSNFETFELAPGNSLGLIEKRAKESLYVPSLPAFRRKAIAIGPAGARFSPPVLGDVKPL